MSRSDQDWMHVLLKEVCRTAATVVGPHQTSTSDYVMVPAADLQALARSLEDVLSLGRTLRPDAFDDGQR